MISIIFLILVLICVHMSFRRFLDYLHFYVRPRRALAEGRGLGRGGRLGRGGVAWVRGVSCGITSSKYICELEIERCTSTLQLDS